MADVFDRINARLNAGNLSRDEINGILTVLQEADKVCSNHAATAVIKLGDDLCTLESIFSPPDDELGDVDLAAIEMMAEIEAGRRLHEMLN